jgi:tetratricopeptide (TPR) repeat protein
MAATEIDIDTDVSGPAAMASPTSVPSVPTVVTQAAATAMISAMTPSSTQQEPTPEMTPTPVIGQGILKMKDVYQAGIAHYKRQDFTKAIRYLKQSLLIHDPYTPTFYYAEANAMLGVIYQFHIIDKGLAWEYYREALKIDPKTATARRHIREVWKSQ